MRISMRDAPLGAMGSSLKNALSLLAVVVAVFFLGAFIVGAYLNFSPVPVGDSWEGMVNFYLRSADEPFAWWEKHNEHRILFSRALFWLDMRFFQGSGLLLIPFNGALLLLLWWLLAAYAKRLIVFPSAKEKTMVVAAVGLLCLSWMHNVNVIAAFQSMFILVFLFPLLAFYCFARALETPSQSLRWRLLSIALATASPLCMANGIFVPPILAALSWYGERSPRWLGIIGASAAVSVAIFLQDYESAHTTGKLIEKLAADPWHVVQFGLTYLGGPFHSITGRVDVAVAAGVVAILATVYLFLRMPRYRSRPFALALFAYVGYVLITAGVTTFGRGMFDLSFAAAGRYLTPTLTMWAALSILLVSGSRHVGRSSALALLVIGTLLLPGERQAFKLNPEILTPQLKAVAALGLQLGINDVGAKNRLATFYSDRFEDIVERARQARATVFADEQAWPANQLGKSLRDAGGEPCTGRMTLQMLVDEKRSAFKVGGTLEPTAAARKYRYILFGDGQGFIKGIAIPGRDADNRAGPAGPPGFDGYLFASPDFSEMRCLR